MTVSVITQYTALEDIKLILSIPDDNTTLDDRLDIIIDDANAEVDTILYSYAAVNTNIRVKPTWN